MGDRRHGLLATTVALAVLAAAPAVRAQPEPAPDPTAEVELEGDPPTAAPATPAAPAEPDPATKAAARKLIAGGDAFFKKGDNLQRKKRSAEAKAQYERALGAYEKAYQLVATPRVLLSMAILAEELERPLDAARHYRGFLAAAPDADPKLRADAEQRLETVKLSIGVLALAVTPEGAEIVIDGTSAGASPLTAPLFLAPGEYTLAITAEGYQPLEQKIAIEAGSESERSFELQAVSVIIEAPRAPPPPVERAPTPPAPSKLVLFVGGGVTVAALGGAVATGLMAMGKNRTFKDSMSATEREDARTSGKNLALITDGLIVGTLVAAGATTYYYLKIYRPRSRDHAHQMKAYREQHDEYARVMPRGAGPGADVPKVIVTPWVQANAGGLAVTGLLW